MRTRLFLTILLCAGFAYTYAQDEYTNRKEFVLKLPVDGKQYYEQKIESGPYFIKEKVLQIYPGEKLFIEAEINKKEITSMRIVKENINPEKTIEIEFIQEVKNRKSELMMLKVVNPFNKDLEYKAMMYIVGHDKWINTSIFPVKARLTGFETWSDVIITLVLNDWKLK